MDIKQSKSILARLLAKENLTVQHKNIPTAYFDTKNRLLALPIWKDMSTDLYDLLTGHEVGHALYTPTQGWHDQVQDKDFGNHFKGFLNVLEDARIEKLIKRQYPGIRKNFYQAYKELYEKDFFGVADTDLDDLLFIDRINLHFKVGAFLNIEFTAQEQELITEIEAIETWDEVVEIAKRLYVMAEDELKDKQMKAEGDLATAVTVLKKCSDDIYAMVNATEADVNSFRQRLGQIEGRVREMQRLTDDQLADRQDEVKVLDGSLNEMAREQIAIIPEFYDRALSLHRDIKGLYREKKIKGYTVGTWAENKDCLWNIAGRQEIYADPCQWPKIWQANTDKIKNPDVIQPGWNLAVPPPGPKTSDEMKAERTYWRKKRVAASALTAPTETATPAVPAQTTKKTEAGN